MNNIIFITGMAGSGKSTVGRLVARHFPKCLFIQVDELREKMVKGYARPEGGVFTEDGWIVLDSSEWTIEQTVNEVLSNIAPVLGNAQS